jgi:hypothetical protein
MQKKPQHEGKLEILQKINEIARNRPKIPKKRNENFQNFAENPQNLTE